MSMSDRKDTILERLRDRMRRREKRENGESQHSKGTRSKRTEKDTRRIDIGWLDFVKGSYKQVRIQNGGGIRRLVVSKDRTVSEIQVEAKELFFPGGISPRGNLEDYNCMMMDVRRLPFNGNPTIGNLHEATKLCVLRLYFATRKTEKKHFTYDSSSEDDQQEDVAELSDSTEDKTDMHVLTDIGGEVTVRTSEGVMTEVVSDSVSDIESDTISIDEGSGALPSGTPTVLFRTSTPVTTSDRVEDTSSEENLQPCLSKRTIVIRRSNVFQDFIQFFKDPEIIESCIDVRMVLPNGDVELGEGTGVYADAVTAFWEEFGKFSAGDQFKVPTLRHDFDADSWESVGRIICKGWKDIGYFPLSLSPPFMEEAIFGKPQGDMKDAFLKYVSASEQSVLEGALSDFPEGDNYDELIDILDGYGCRVLPTKTNLSQILYELGHQEIIQKPMFIADSMRNALKPLRKDFKTQSLRELYEAMTPTSQKIIGRIRVGEDLTEKQRAIFTYLKKYIRSLEKNKLHKLLRFWSGADMLAFQHLTLSFNDQDGFARRPIAHTCSQCLELSTTYENYLQLKNEVNEVLDSGIWVMDIK